MTCHITSNSTLPVSLLFTLRLKIAPQTQFADVQECRKNYTESAIHIANFTMLRVTGIRALMTLWRYRDMAGNKAAVALLVPSWGRATAPFHGIFDHLRI
jgi:hypothetical protein